MAITKDVNGVIQYEKKRDNWAFDETGVVPASQFTVADDSDVLKQARFSLVTLPTNTRVILGVPSSSGTLALEGGGGSPSFSTIQTPAGTSPVATGPSDILTLTNSTGEITITGNAATDTVDYSVRTASGTQSGVLSSTDFTSFSSKQAALSFGAITSPTDAVTVNNGTGAVIGTGTSFVVRTASGSQSGIISSTDFTTFNGKQAALSFGALTSPTDAVTVNNGTGAVIGTGTSFVVRTASGTQSGILSSTDFTTFNGKQASLSFGALTSPTDAVTITNGSGSVIGTGTSVSVRLASGTQSGILSSTDFTTFSAKVNRSGDTITGGLTINGSLTIDTNLKVTGSTTLANHTGILRASSGVVTTTQVSLTADVVGILPIANGGTNATTAVSARVSLNVNALRLVSNADTTITATDRVVLQNGTMSAPRTFTLPAASALVNGEEIVIVDSSGSVSSTNTITIARAGSDTINGLTFASIISPYEPKKLVSDGVSSWSVSGQSGVDFQQFTSSGNWTKRAGIQSVRRVVIAGGGGGGSGAKGTAGIVRAGGGGGSGGGYSDSTIPASLCGATETIIVGATAAGGASQTTNSSVGNDGTAGNLSSFGTAGTAQYLAATGGQGGQGGGSGAITGVPGGSGTSNGGAGRDVGAAAPTPGATGDGVTGAGGAGGGITSGNTARTGAVGGRAGSNNIAGGAGGAANTNGTAGSGSGFTNPIAGGSGGGGGGGSTSTNAGTGGAGGLYGGGGGGGGAATDSVGNSGAGGTGQQGAVYVFSW